MKQIIAAAALLLAAFSTRAQDFAPVMTKTFTAFDTTFNPQQKLEQGNKIGLIAKKFDQEWVAQYYLAYSKTQLAYMEQDGAKKEALLDEADMAMSQAIKLYGKEDDETYVMKAMIANARMTVDPRARYATFGKQFTENLEKAKEVNPENPRIYLELGITKYFTPAMFGGGKKAAMPYLEKAKGLYAKSTQHDIRKPYWGEQTADYFIGLANGTIQPPPMQK